MSSQSGLSKGLSDALRRAACPVPSEAHSHPRSPSSEPRQNRCAFKSPHPRSTPPVNSPIGAMRVQRHSAESRSPHRPPCQPCALGTLGNLSLLACLAWNGALRGCSALTGRIESALCLGQLFHPLKKPALLLKPLYHCHPATAVLADNGSPQTSVPPLKMEEGNADSFVYPVPKIGMEKGMSFTTDARCGSLWRLPVLTGGPLTPRAGGGRRGSHWGPCHSGSAPTFLGQPGRHAPS